ncbi:unnamed protein product [Acanthoscelides obtectus]|uniref:Uncharacterized protein n=1 Tax=Acanthoscelides obtectus TaxID=200917 RepID=A0A9P0K5U6_ACAOB|nr:unnamed protein product [Acanthoscelides obtectus]CAK1669957.1 hypothetical protein AOBTE_LOCUS27323 [Acanthoscelides obtectus]
MKTTNIMSKLKKQKSQPPKIVIHQDVKLSQWNNLNNTFKQPESKKRKHPLIFFHDGEEELVAIDPCDDKVEKILQSLSKTDSGISKDDNVTQNGAQRSSRSEQTDVGVQCKLTFVQKHVGSQCCAVKRKDAAVQSNFVTEKVDAQIQSCLTVEQKNAQSQCECQPLAQEHDLLHLVKQCSETPLGKGKDLDQLIRLCKKIKKKPPAELRNKEEEEAVSSNRTDRVLRNMRKAKTDPENKKPIKKRKVEEG